MSIAINLLPDIRQQRILEARRRRMVLSVSVIVWVACGVVVLLLFLLSTGQKVAIDDASKKIASKEAEIESTSDLIDALTAQQHIASLPAVIDRKILLSKFFTAYSEVNPKAVALDSLSVTDINVLNIAGTATSYGDVAKLARSLEGSNVVVGTGALATNSPYFTGVSIDSASANDQGKRSFVIKANISTEVLSGK